MDTSLPGSPSTVPMEDLSGSSLTKGECGDTPSAGLGRWSTEEVAVMRLSRRVMATGRRVQDLVGVVVWVAMACGSDITENGNRCRRPSSGQRAAPPTVKWWRDQRRAIGAHVGKCLGVAHVMPSVTTDTGLASNPRAPLVDELVWAAGAEIGHAAMPESCATWRTARPLESAKRVV